MVWAWLARPVSGTEEEMRKAIVMAMVAVLALTLAAPAVSAKAEHMPASWLQATCTIDPVPPTYAGGSMHVRGETHYDEIYMNFGFGYVQVGENTIVFDYDLSLATFNGRGGGTFEVSVDLNPYVPFAWTGSGHFNGQIKAGMLRARAVGHGTGDSEGDLLAATIRQIDPEDFEDFMCEGGEVVKAVAVSGRITDK